MTAQPDERILWQDGQKMMNKNLKFKKFKFA